MGRPVRKGWFSSYFGPATVNLNVLTTAGAQVISDQPGTSTYTVPVGGQVRLVDGTVTLAAGLCQLQHNGNYVRKLDQFNAYYFNGTSAIWNNGADVPAIVGTFDPAPSAASDTEPGAPVVVPPVVPPVVPVTATATAGLIDDGLGNGTSEVSAIIVTDGGAGYTVAPAVTIDGDGTGATATAVLAGDAVGSVTVDTAGSGYTTATVTIAAP